MKISIPQQSITALQNQITHELNNKHIYLDMEAYFSNLNLNGCRDFFKMQAEGEDTHARAIIDYLDARNAPYKVTVASFNSQVYTSIGQIFEKALEVEQDTTQRLYAIRNDALQTNDFMTVAFLDTGNGGKVALIPEQQEEEQLAMQILSRIEQYGLQNLDLSATSIDSIDAVLRNSLVQLDREMSDLVDRLTNQ